MTDDIQFLKELQTELKTQGHDCQASPRFWTLMDYKWVVTEEGYHDRTSLCFPNGEDSITTDEFVKSVLDGKIKPCKMLFNKEFTEEQIEGLETSYELGYEEEICDWARENYDSECYLIYEKEESFIVPDTMFLTKQEAKNHLKNNAHHYSNKAHTYAMTAWRSPKVERLLKILETFNWDLI